MGDRAFAVAAPRASNSLPDAIRRSSSLAVFKRLLKTYFYTECFYQHCFDTFRPRVLTLQSVFEVTFLIYNTSKLTNLHCITLHYNLSSAQLCSIGYTIIEI